MDSTVSKEGEEMNGKLRKIALGMSVLMCMGVFFTCALPAKAAKVCQHISRCYLGMFKEGESINDEEHYYTIEERACCETCGATIVLRTETGRESHNFYTTYDPQGRLIQKYCADCDKLIIYLYN